MDVERFALIRSTATNVTTLPKDAHYFAYRANYTYILARTYPTIFPFSSSATYESWGQERP